MIFKEYKKLNLSKISDEILLYWKNQDIFKKSVEQSKDKNPFIFFEGPPSANGLPGIHHVLARSIKDIFLRYKTMKGYHVQRKAGWDTHGLPVELGVENALGITKEDIGKKITIEDYSISMNLESEEREALEELFNSENLKNSSNNININYDGTPITWVLKVEKALLEKSYDVLEEELLRNSFISLEDGDFILIGPYIDRSQLYLAQDYLNEKYGKDLGVIEKWQI